MFIPELYPLLVVAAAEFRLTILVGAFGKFYHIKTEGWSSGNIQYHNDAMSSFYL